MIITTVSTTVITSSANRMAILTNTIIRGIVTTMTSITIRIIIVTILIGIIALLAWL